MAILYQYGIKVAAGFEVLDSVPLDARTVVSSFIDLTNTLTTSIVFEGMLVYVVDEQKYYSWNGYDHTLDYNWRDLFFTENLSIKLLELRIELEEYADNGDNLKYDLRGGVVEGSAEIDGGLLINPAYVSGGSHEGHSLSGYANSGIHLPGNQNIIFGNGAYEQTDALNSGHIEGLSSMDVYRLYVIGEVYLEARINLTDRVHLNWITGGYDDTQYDSNQNNEPDYYQYAYNDLSQFYSQIEVSEPRRAFTFLVKDTSRGVIDEYIFDQLDSNGDVMTADGDERIKTSRLISPITATKDIGGISANNTYAHGTDLESILRELLEEPISSTASISSVSLLEKGVSSTVVMTLTYNAGTDGTFTSIAGNFDSIDSSNNITYNNKTSTFIATSTVLFSGGSADASRTVTFVAPQYIGISSSSSLDYSSISNLESSFSSSFTKKIQSSSSMSDSFTTSNEYIYFISSSGSLDIKDENDFTYNSDWNITTVSMTLEDGTSQTMYEYRTKTTKNLSSFLFKIV